MDREKKFLDWYFNGYDDEKQDTLIELGTWVRDSLYENGSITITLKDLKDYADMEVFYQDCNLK